MRPLLFGGSAEADAPDARISASPAIDIVGKSKSYIKRRPALSVQPDPPHAAFCGHSWARTMGLIIVGLEFERRLSRNDCCNQHLAAMLLRRYPEPSGPAYPRTENRKEY